MNLKEAFRYQNKLQTLMDEAQGILSCDANVTKVENTYLRHQVMAEAQDETVLIAPETEYYEQITGVAQFLLYLLEEKGKLFAALRKAMVKSFIIEHLRSFPAREARGLSRCRRSTRDKWLKLHRTLAAPQTASHKMRRASYITFITLYPFVRLRRRKMTTRELEIFSTVMECGTMSAAARKLHISQSSVSQVVVELEHKYDVLLFERYVRTLHLTDVGQTLLEYARQTLNLARESETFLRGATQRPRLRVGVSVTVECSVLCSVLEQLRRELPQIMLEVVVSNTQNIQERLLRYELDIGVVKGLVTHPDLVKERIVGDTLALICGQGHPFFGLKSVPMRELDGQTFLLREEGTGQISSRGF